MATRYLVSYDVADEERLRKVHKVVRAFGQRVQDSVYESILTKLERVKLEGLLKERMNLKEDQVLFINLGDGARSEVSEIEALGISYKPLKRGPIVV